MTKITVCELCGMAVNGADLYPVYRGMHLMNEHNVKNFPTLERIVKSGKFFVQVKY